MVNAINKIRFWLLNLILTEDEKFMLKRAIEDRMYNLCRIAVNERWADASYIAKDYEDYRVLKDNIKTVLWA